MKSRDELIKTNLSEDMRILYNLLGKKNFKKMLKCFGGMRVYIMKEEALDMIERNIGIYIDYRKNIPIRKLTKKWGLSESWISRIVNNIKKYDEE